MQKTVDDIKSRFEVLGEQEQRSDLHKLELPREQILPLLAWLKSRTGFVQLTHLSVVDWIEDGRFELVYLLADPARHLLMMISTRIGRDGDAFETASDLWPQAVTYEQEIAEMYGIPFEGSPRTGDEFILEGWSEIPPMRREFDTLKFASEFFPERGGREHIDPGDYIRKHYDIREKAHD